MAQEANVDVSGITNLSSNRNGRVLYLEPTNIPNVQEIITMNSKKLVDMVDDLVTWDEIQYKSIENSKYAYLYPKRFNPAEVADAEQSIVDLQRRIESIVGDIKTFGEDDLPMSGSAGKNPVTNYVATATPNVSGIKSGKILGSTANGDISVTNVVSLGGVPSNNSVSAHEIASPTGSSLNVSGIATGGNIASVTKNDAINSGGVINSVVGSGNIGTTIPTKLGTDVEDTKKSTFVGGVGLASVAGAGAVGGKNYYNNKDNNSSTGVSSDSKNIENKETSSVDLGNEMNKEFNSVDFKNEILKLGEEEF